MNLNIHTSSISKKITKLSWFVLIFIFLGWNLQVVLRKRLYQMWTKSEASKVQIIKECIRILQRPVIMVFLSLKSDYPFVSPNIYSAFNPESQAMSFRWPGPVLLRRFRGKERGNGCGEDHPTVVLTSLNISLLFNIFHLVLEQSLDYSSL